MRGLQATSFRLYPSLWGSMCVNAKTACGNAIDTRGFRGCLATMVCASAASSSGASDLALTCKIQQAETMGAAGASWTDITDGAINGSFKLTQIALTGSGASMYAESMYERLDRLGRQRYIRAYVEATSSNAAASLGVRVSVNLVLTDPVDTLYVVDAATFATTNAEFYYTLG
jgi:hypothetical protein